MARTSAKSAEHLLTLVTKEGKVKAGQAAGELGVSKDDVLAWAHKLAREGLVEVKTHLLRDTSIIATGKPVHDTIEPVEGATIIAVSNQKGGVGKTVTAVNLAAALADLKKHTLLVDSDPQANATSGLGFDKHSIDYSIYDVLIKRRPARETILPTAVERLDIMPSNVDLAGAEVELVDLVQRETRLAAALNKLRPRYDYIIIDCPPALSLLTVNALTTADGVIIPIQCDYYALEGVGQLMETVSLVRERLNPRLKILGVLLTMYDFRINLSVQVAGEVKRYFKKQVFNAVIPRNVKLAEAPSFGKTILQYDRGSTGAAAYLKLAREVIKSGRR